MRERDALRAARRFVAESYPDCADWRVEVCLEHDGERRRSWSFGVHPDEEDPEYAEHGDRGLVGYVHADGHIEGLY